MTTPTQPRQLFPASWNVQIPPAPRGRQASVGDLIGRTMGTLRSRLGDVTFIVAITAGVAFILQAGSAMVFPKPEPGAFSMLALAGTIVTAIIAGVLMVWLQTSLTLLSGAERLGAPISRNTALREGLEAVPAGIWTRTVQAMVLVVGFIALIVPAIIFAVRFCVGMQISAFEKRSGLDALRASNELVREHTWETFSRLFGFWVVQFLATIAFAIAAVIFLLIVAVALKAPTVAAVVGALTYLFVAGFAIAFYSIWRTEFYLALVDERRALAPVEMPDPEPPATA